MSPKPSLLVDQCIHWWRTCLKKGMSSIGHGPCISWYGPCNMTWFLFIIIINATILYNIHTYSLHAYQSHFNITEFILLKNLNKSGPFFAARASTPDWKYTIVLICCQTLYYTPPQLNDCSHWLTVSEHYCTPQLNDCSHWLTVSEHYCTQLNDCSDWLTVSQSVTKRLFSLVERQVWLHHRVQTTWAQSATKRLFSLVERQVWLHHRVQTTQSQSVTKQLFSLVERQVWLHHRVQTTWECCALSTKQQHIQVHIYIINKYIISSVLE